jgi:hypothetical protein
MEIEFLCAECRSPNNPEFEKSDENQEVLCGSCKKRYGLIRDLMDPDGKLQKCGICGCRDLYIQKDFNRKLGLAIVAIGAILAPFTKLISLLVCALIDLVLYKMLPLITICYRCGSIYRGFAFNPDHQPFNLGINDRYRSSER